VLVGFPTGDVVGEFIAGVTRSLHEFEKRIAQGASGDRGRAQPGKERRNGDRGHRVERGAGAMQSLLFGEIGVVPHPLDKIGCGKRILAAKEMAKSRVFPRFELAGMRSADGLEVPVELILRERMDAGRAAKSRRLRRASST